MAPVGEATVIVPVAILQDGWVVTAALTPDGAVFIVKTILSVTVKPLPVTVIVSVTVPEEISAALGVYNVAPKVALANVPVPEVVHAIVPFVAVPVVVYVLDEHIDAVAGPASAVGAGSLSVIVTIPKPSVIDAFVGSDKITLKYSTGSLIASLTIGMVIFLVRIVG